MTFEQAVAYMSSLAPRGWRLGLDRMQEFVRRSECLSGEIPKYIHIAGTNGKGSTTAMIQSCLVEQGFRTGAFFSPYVVDPRERVQLGRELISHEDFAKIVSFLHPIGESLSATEFGGITEFELKTALGFEFWKQNKCDFVALEVGLGGRLDATNVIDPASSAIVSIGLDHVSILGDSLDKIAYEKAGILKPGKPAVVGEMDPLALYTIEEVAREVEAPIWRVGKEVVWRREGDRVRITTPNSEIVAKPSLFGEIQMHNAAVAYGALELGGAIKDDQGVIRGLETAYLPGRFEIQTLGSQRWVLDGAHNMDSARVLAQMIEQRGTRFKVCITAMLRGHDPVPFYDCLAPYVDEFWVGQVDMPRSYDREELAEVVRTKFPKVRTVENAKAALEAAEGRLDLDEILVTGSFFWVGEIMRQLEQRRSN